MLSHDQTADNYWRLDQYTTTPNKSIRTFLSARGVPHRHNAHKSEFVEHLHRLDRGNLIYGKCNENELRHFIKKRKLVQRKKNRSPSPPPPPGPFPLMTQESNVPARVLKKARFRDLQQLLENADDEPKFHRFMDLPPELRERISEFHFAQFGSVGWKPADDGRLRVMSDAERAAFPEKKPLRHPMQPPLTRTCKQLRQEMLPVFYKKCTFDFHLAYTMKAWESESERGMRFARIHPETRSWMTESLEESANFNLLRSIRLVVQMFDRPSSSVNEGDTCFIYEIEVDAGDEGVKLYGSKPKYKDAQKSIKAELQKVLDDIDAREGPGKFRKDDIFAFRKAIEKSFGWPWKDVYMNH